jgi:BirA family biotin operon repressor/biotin-[acetyl-CoA-carboxylase] ligase
VTDPSSFDLSPIVDDVLWCDEIDSTSTFLVRQSLGNSIAVLSWNQTGGRGRLGREWISPAGKSLAMSVGLWPEVLPGVLSTEWLGALSLISAATLADALRPHLSEPIRIKWPNDVMISGKKVAGILGEIPLPGLVIVGVGLNVSLSEDELPTENATSLGLHGMDANSVDQVVRTFLIHLRQALEMSRDGLSHEMLAWLSEQVETLGSRVRVDFPGGNSWEGTALSLDRSGRLKVQFDGSDQPDLIDSADVWHLRPAQAG